MSSSHWNSHGCYMHSLPMCAQMPTYDKCSVSDCDCWRGKNRTHTHTIFSFSLCSWKMLEWKKIYDFESLSIFHISFLSSFELSGLFTFWMLSSWLRVRNKLSDAFATHLKVFSGPSQFQRMPWKVEQCGCCTFIHIFGHATGEISSIINAKTAFSCFFDDIGYIIILSFSILLHISHQNYKEYF